MKKIRISESQYTRLFINEQCTVGQAITALEDDGNYNVTRKDSQSSTNQLLTKCLSENPLIKGFFGKISANQTVKVKVIPKGYGCYIVVEPKSVPPNKDSIWVNIHTNKTIHVMYEFAEPKGMGVIKKLWYKGDIVGDEYSNLKLVKPVDANMGDISSTVLDDLRSSTILNFGACSVDEILKNNYGIPDKGNIMNNIIEKMHTNNFTNNCKTISD